MINTLYHVLIQSLIHALSVHMMEAGGAFYPVAYTKVSQYNVKCAYQYYVII